MLLYRVASCFPCRLVKYQSHFARARAVAPLPPCTPILVKSGRDETTVPTPSDCILDAISLLESPAASKLSVVPSC